MPKYDPLRNHLAAQTAEQRITLKFADIEAMVGGLPRSAWDHQAWWGNQHGHAVQAEAWNAAGYKVEKVDQKRGYVTFVKA